MFLSRSAKVPFCLTQMPIALHGLSSYPRRPLPRVCSHPSPVSHWALSSLCFSARYRTQLLKPGIRDPGSHPNRGSRTHRKYTPVPRWRYLHPAPFLTLPPPQITPLPAPARGPNCNFFSRPGGGQLGGNSGNIRPKGGPPFQRSIFYVFLDK